MRSIILFIWRNNFIFLFLLFESFSAYLLVQNNSFQRASFLNSSDFIAANLYESFDNMTGYFGLREENERLAEENEELYGQSIMSYVQFVDGEFIHNDTVYHQQYTYLNARVINNSINKRNNYLTLNRGTNQGVEREMGVISSLGVIGIVKDVSANFSTVLSLLHADSRTSVKILGKDYFGSAIWNGDDFTFGTVTELPTHIRINKGDKIVTSGFSAIFPEGLRVGIVEDIDIVAGDKSYTLKIKYASDFASLANVYLVSNLLKVEQSHLEDTTLQE
ncbi:MAG: rod shape-determining protein MreC [Bacteroidetes bacterium]|nr:MAG: rod shape-determining protein MreC [Bacteroidota bacterium]